jgi:AraC family transcriptional regulator
MEPIRIEEKPPIHLIGLRATFVSGLAENTDAGEVIGPLWERLDARLPEIQRSEPKALYGYCFHLPPEAVTRENELGYFAGAPVAADAPVPNGLESFDTAAGLYAVFEHHGPITRILETLRPIYADWLPQSGFIGSGAGDVEVYDERFRGGGPDSVVEYWVGIRPVP